MGMRRAVLLAVAIVAAFPAAASAKAPEGLRTAEEITALARQQAEADAKKREDALKDPVKELIAAYAQKGKTPLGEWKPVVDLILSTKTDAVHRFDAAKALVARFAAEDVAGDPAVKAVRRDISEQLYPLLGTVKSDQAGILAADLVFKEWWRLQHSNFRYNAAGSQSDRKDAMNKFKKFLQKEKD